MKSRFAHVATVVAAFGAATLHSAVPAAAGPFEAVFGQRELSACFYRDYDAAHLGAHARQQTRIIEIDMEPPDSDQQAYTPERFELGVGVMARAGSDWYTANAICKTSGTGFSCYLEGDGGEFTLAPLPDGGMELATRGFNIEGDSGFLELGNGKTDDTKFLLRPADHTLCDASTAAARGE